MTTPSLWSRLDIDLTSSHSSTLEWILRKSGSSRLVIYLCLNSTTQSLGSLCQSLLDLLVAQSSRWYYLYLSVPLSFLRTSLACIHSNLDQLYSVAITLETLVETSEPISEQSTINAFEIAPNLRELIGSTLLLRHFLFPWTQIVKFEMPGRFGLDDDASGWQTTAQYPLDDVRESFLRMPFATHACIRNITTVTPSGSNDDSAAIRHDRLVQLKIFTYVQASYLQPTGQLLSVLEAPDLEALVLYSPNNATLDEWNHLSNALITNTAGLLSGLTLLGFHLSAISIPSLTKIFGSCLALRDLILVEYEPIYKHEYQGQKMNEVVDLLTIGLSAPVSPTESDMLVPNLESISINTCSRQFDLKSFTRMISSRATSTDDFHVGLGLGTGVKQRQKLTSVKLNVRMDTLNRSSQDILDLAYLSLVADDLCIDVKDKTGTVIGKNFRWIREPRVRSFSSSFILYVANVDIVLFGAGNRICECVQEDPLKHQFHCMERLVIMHSRTPKSSVS
jgi:hypothetical protein